MVPKVVVFQSWKKLQVLEKKVIYFALFTLPCLYLFTLTYLYFSMFFLYYYMNLIKLIKYGKYRNYDETF